MTGMRNVLYVTTRQWNPGDEFILAGVQSVLRAADWEPKVEAIFNKSPQVVGKLTHRNPFRMKHANLSAGYADSFVQTAHFDNSFGPVNDIRFFDAVVFCGSPGWFGGRLAGLYAKLADYRGKILYLGIGSSNRALKLSATEVGVLRRAEIVTCRDERLSGALAERYGVPSEWMTCPALLAAPYEAQPDALARIALVYTSTSTNRGQRVSAEHEALQNEVFEQLIHEHGAVDIICNYYDEVDHAAARFGADRVRYAFDARDYVSLTAQYSFVVSSRVHGCGLASSLGIPNVLLGHDRRADTVRGFGSAVTTDVAQIRTQMDSFAEEGALRAESDRLVALKRDLLSRYVTRMPDAEASVTRR